MPVITISAVDTGTDTLTATAHGLLTGDRCRVRNVGGALPTGLSAATDYFAIRVDANNIKLATSSANALLGTAINLTGAGSGTNTLEYGLPYCIPTALAAPLTQVRSADQNGTWNALVALYSFLVGIAQSVWTGITLAANQHITISGTGRYKHGDLVKTFHPYAIQTPDTITRTSGVSALGTNGGNYFLALQGFDVGQRVKSVTVDLFGNGADDVAVTFRKTNTGVESTIDTFNHLNQAASWSQVTFDLTDTTLAAGDSLELQFSPNGTAIRVGATNVTYDRP